jgi:ADP-heptose:LPS heptosyltransferase
MQSVRKDVGPPDAPILIIRLSAWGDLMAAVGAMHDIRLHHPNARIDLLTGSGFAAFMARCPHLDRIIGDPRPTWTRPWRLVTLTGRLAGTRYGRVYDLQRRRRTALYRRLMPPHGTWITDPYAAGVTRVNLRQPRLGWAVDDATDILTAAAVPDRFVVLVNGGSTGNTHRRWPHYQALAQALLDVGIAVVTVPGPDELDLAPLPGIQLTGGRFLNRHQLAGVLDRASYVVGNDTGPMHLATYLQTPGCIIRHPYRVSSIFAENGMDEAVATDLATIPVQAVLDRALEQIHSKRNRFE